MIIHLYNMAIRPKSHTVLLCLFCCAALLFVATTPVEAFDKIVRIYIRSFIPIEQSGVKDFAHRTEAGTWVIKAPDIRAPAIGYLEIGKLNGTCFSTDDRSFDPSPNKSARATIDFVMRFTSTREFEIVPPPGKAAVKGIGITRNVDCKTGNDLQSPRQADVEGLIVGNVRKNGNLRIFNVRGAASDPFYKIAGVSVAPNLDFDIVFEFDQISKKLKIKGSTGVFPAFEAYAVVDGKTHALWTIAPAQGSTAYSLFEFGTGIGPTANWPFVGVTTRNFDAELELREYLLAK